MRPHVLPAHARARAVARAFRLRSIAQAAREFGVDPETIRHWIAAAELSLTWGSGRGGEVRAERLSRERRREIARMGAAALPKAARRRAGTVTAERRRARAVEARWTDTHEGRWAAAVECLMATGLDRERAEERATAAVARRLSA